MRSGGRVRWTWRMSEPRGDLRPPGLNADARTTLLTFLDHLRDAVAAKASGLPGEAARSPGVASGTSLLVHMIE